MGWLSKLFNTNNTMEQLKGSIIVLKAELDDAIAQAKEEFRKNEVTLSAYKDHVLLVNEMSDAANCMIWRKDADGTYLYANKLRCVTMFGVETCADYLGRTDCELIATHAQALGKPITFLSTCRISDDLVHTTGCRITTLERGCIGDKEYTFYVVKTPVYSTVTNQFTGTAGFAFDCTGTADTWHRLMEKLKQDGLAVQLHKDVVQIRGTPSECVAPYLSDVDVDKLAL